MSDLEKWDEESYAKNEVDCFADLVSLLDTEKILHGKKSVPLKDDALNVFPDLIRRIQWDKIKKRIGSDKKSIRNLDILKRIADEHSFEIRQLLESFCLDTANICTPFDTSKDSMELNELALIFRDPKSSGFCYLLVTTRDQLIPLLRRLIGTVQRSIISSYTILDTMKKQIQIVTTNLKTEGPPDDSSVDDLKRLNLSGKHSITVLLEHAQQIEVIKQQLKFQRQELSERLEKGLMKRIAKIAKVQKTYKKSTPQLQSPVDRTEIDQKIAEIKSSEIKESILLLIDLANLVQDAEQKHTRQKESFLINAYQTALETIKTVRTFGHILQKQPKDFPTSHRVAAYKQLDEWTRSVPTIEETVKDYAAILDESDELNESQISTIIHVREISENMYSHLGIIKERTSAFNEDMILIELDSTEKDLRDIRGRLTSEILQLSELADLDARTRRINVELRDILNAPIRGSTQYWAPDAIARKLDLIKNQYDEFETPLPPGSTESDDIMVLLETAIELLTWRQQVEEKLAAFLRNRLYNQIREHNISCPGATPKDIVSSRLEGLFNIYEMLSRVMENYKEDILEQIEVKRRQMQELEKSGSILLNSKFEAKVPTADNLEQAEARVTYLSQLDLAVVNTIETIYTRFVKLLVSTSSKLVNKDTEKLFKTMCDAIDATKNEIEKSAHNEELVETLLKAKSALVETLHREYESSRDESASELELLMKSLPEDSRPERSFLVGLDEFKSLKISDEYQKLSQEISDTYKKRKSLLLLLSKSIQNRLKSLSTLIASLETHGVKVDASLSKPPDHVTLDPSRLQVGADLIFKTSQTILQACSKALGTHTRNISESALKNVDIASNQLLEDIDAFATLDENLRSEVTENYISIEAERVENLQDSALRIREIVHELRNALENFNDILDAKD